MSSAKDYKKRLMEYRKSIGATNITNLKTVAFRDPTSPAYEDIQLRSPQFSLPKMTLHYQQEKDTSVEDGGSDAGESSISKSASPQPQTELLPRPAFLHGSSFLNEPVGRYINWNSHHALLAAQPWCTIGELMGFCDRYEFKAISVSDVPTHANIVEAVKSLLSGKAPFDMRRRFPAHIRNDGNLLVCIGRCPSIEYHLQRILSIFRRPLNKLSTDKQNIAKQNFHITIRELHLDVSARITGVRLYDRTVFEKEFQLRWLDTLE